jgi:hypothetical protein
VPSDSFAFQEIKMMQTSPSPSLDHAFQPPEAAAQSARERMTWIIELMSRFATEKLEHHDSARLAAVIVTHLNALAAETPQRTQLSETVSHWLDTWEPILERQLALQGRSNPWPVSLRQLVMRARFA